MPREAKLERKKDPMYGYIQVTKTEVLPQPNLEVVSESDTNSTTHAIYIFLSSKGSGIKLIVKENNGLYITNADSISIVQWDDKVNSESHTLLKQKGGNEIAETFIVSEKEFKRICDDILRQFSNDEIIISVKENIFEYYDNRYLNNANEYPTNIKNNKY